MSLALLYSPSLAVWGLGHQFLAELATFLEKGITDGFAAGECILVQVLRLALHQISTEFARLLTDSICSRM